MSDPLRIALVRIQELVLRYEAEGVFPSNPAEEVLDEIDAICLAILKVAHNKAGDTA